MKINLTRWLKRYNLAKAYYNHYDNLDVPENFKTFNGINYDAKGFNLGAWVIRNRTLYGKGELINEQIRLLNDIKMVWSYNDLSWNIGYKHAKDYYNAFNNLLVPIDYVTDDGFRLGQWINIQRRAYHNKGTNKITKEQIKLLEDIKMVWDVNSYKWQFMYELAKNYYNKNVDLIIPNNFKTLDGITYNKDGYDLYSWIISNREDNKKRKLTKNKIDLLNKIGMNWDLLDDIWLMMFELCKNYYNYYGNFDVPKKFKTVDGIKYDAEGYNLYDWINTQKRAYVDCNKYKISIKRIELLNSLNIKWFNKPKDLKLQNEEITLENTNRKQQEIINRTYTYLNVFDGNELPSKEDINKKFILKLDRKI